MGPRALASGAVAAAVAACAVAARSPAPAATGAASLAGASAGASAVDYGVAGPAVVRVVDPEGGVPPVVEADGGFRCGCALCAPVLSTDKCVTAADCAPEQPCHAERCVARAKAKPRTPETVCTMDIRCNTADVNRCACIQGVCALAPPSHR